MRNVDATRQVPGYVCLVDHTDITSTCLNTSESFDPWPSCDAHLEWGVAGAELAADRGDVVIVVDVLSFSTTLTIAVSRDFRCYVYSKEEIRQMGGTAECAKSLGAIPLSKTRDAPAGQVSLSPESLLGADPGQTVLFTSLNGAAVVGVASRAPAVLVGSLRNAAACAAAAGQYVKEGTAQRVTVVPCGELWSSASPGTEGFRPALEDQVGAGAICARLADVGLSLSPEAAVAAGNWRQALDALSDCTSARELQARGFATDVELALDVDADTVVPTRAPPPSLLAAGLDEQPQTRLFVSEASIAQRQTPLGW